MNPLRNEVVNVSSCDVVDCWFLRVLTGFNLLGDVEASLDDGIDSTTCECWVELVVVERDGLDVGGTNGDAIVSTAGAKAEDVGEDVHVEAVDLVDGKHE